MNAIFGERKQRSKKTAEDVQRLRDELAARDEENERLREHSSLVSADNSRIQQLEEEIAGLRHELESGELGGTAARRTLQHYDDWDMGAADAFSDHDSILDADVSLGGDTTVEGTDYSSSTPVLQKAFLSAGPTLTPPSTSPTKPPSPGFQHCASSTSDRHAGTQASLDDPEKAALRAELASLRADLANISKSLEAQQQLESDLRAKLSLAEGSYLETDCDPDLQLQTDIMLQNLAEKTAELVDLKTSLTPLVGPDPDPREAIWKLTRAMRSAQVEVEQLFPGETATLMSPQGTEILDLVLRRLRDVAGQVKEYESALEASHENEASLLQKLDDRAREMDDMSCQLKSKDKEISQLETDVCKLNDAAEGYRGQLAELESIVRRMETEGKEAQARFVVEIEAGKQSAARKDDQLAELEARLASALHNATDLKNQLADSLAARTAETAALEAAHEDDIELRDARELKLLEEITKLKAALSGAHETISQLRAENGRLRTEADQEKKSARDAVGCLRTQLMGALQMSEAFLCPPVPTHQPGKADARIDPVDKREETPTGCALPPSKLMD